ncbi:hypothetical protein QL093DRAFT_2310914 [Fusarium oxysporum]|nr:hypothetical protein QL093DRAFT_2310914 [Fusarium oxysporum]
MDRSLSTSHHEVTPNLKIWSCSHATIVQKNKIDCHFPVTGRIPRRTRDAKTPAQKQSELLSRLRRLESVVTELAAQVEDENGAKTMGQITVDKEPTESSWATSSGSLDHQTSEFDEDFGRLVVDKDGGLHVGNRFWTVFCSEVDNILQAVHDVADISETPSNSIMTEPTSNGTPAPLSHLGFVFGSAEFAKALDGLNPMPSQMLFIWQTYVENVDPFIKVLHTPAIENIVKQLKGNFSSCGHDVEALLFAICLAAIASMDEKTVSFNFNTPQRTTAAAPWSYTYRCYPNIGAQDKVWPLSGLLLRLAKSVCLHREGDPHQYNQLEREIRRRLWWHICFIDSSSRRADAQDLSITPASPNPNQGSTGVTLCLIRCELWYLTQAIRADTTDSLETRLGLLNALRQKVEKTYFQHLQPNQPWDSFIRLNWLFDDDPKTLPAADELLTPSITVTKAVQSLKSGPAWVKWRWQLQGQMPWHAMGVYLRQASRLPWTRELEEAWGATTALKEGVTEEMKTGSLWRSLMQLFSEAEQHREMELKRQGANAQHTRDKGDRVNSDVQQMLNNAENMSNEIPVNHPLIDTSTFDSSLHISPPADNGALSVERLSTSLGTAADDLPSWVEAGCDMNFGQGQNFGNSSSDGTADGVDWEALMDLDETWNWDFL